MNQRFTLDRKSFEQFLCVVSLLQQLRKQAAYRRAMADPNQPLLSLLQLQRTISSGTVHLESAMSAVTKLALSVVGATSAGIWLFRASDEFTCCARIGAIYDPERLGVDILAHLADDQASRDSDSFPTPLRKASHYPGYPNSLAIAPLRMGGQVLGALGVFSTEFEAFRSRDLDNLHFLASLFEQAIHKAVRSGYRDAVALEREAIRQLLENITPRVRDLREQLPSRSAPAGIPIEREPIVANAAGRSVEPSSLQPVYSRISAPEVASAHISAQPNPKDLSIPGVGVRAALGDTREYTGESESFSLFSAIRVGAARTLGRAANYRSTVSSFAAASLVPVRDAIAHLMRSTARIAKYRPNLAVPRLPSVLMRTRNSVANLANRKVKVHVVRTTPFRDTALPVLELFRSRRIRVHLLSLSKSFVLTCKTFLNETKARYNVALKVGRVQASTARRTLRQTSANLSAAIGQQRTRMRVARRRQTNVLASSAEITGDALQHAGASLAEVASSAGQSTMTVMEFLRTRLSTLSGPALDKRALRKSAGALAVLAIMLGFLLLQAHNSLRTEPVSAAMRSPAATSASSQLAFGVTATTVAKSGPPSHLEITDDSVAESLHDLTRYEIATLQRAADYGDDEAAFQLGMAYETGYYVRQNCSKAAHWVKMAAEEGNPAAAYNLALRYRTADGLPADKSAAEHWLHMASAQKYSPAKLALATGS